MRQPNFRAAALPTLLFGFACFGVDAVEKVGHESVEFFGLPGHRGGEVVCFGEIFGEVEEFEAVFFPGPDELEVAEAERGLGSA